MNYLPQDGIECIQCKNTDTIVQNNKLMLGYDCKCRTCGKLWFVYYEQIGT